MAAAVRRTRIMGIVNITPDSFSGDGLSNVDSAVHRALRLASEGADIIDLGGESTRPGASPVGVKEELTRVLPAIAGIAHAVDLPISVDTRKPAVAEAALDVGAAWINDVSGTLDPAIAQLAAAAGAGLIVVHRGVPNPGDDLLVHVLARLRLLAEMALQAGISPDRLMVDPGLGIGKGWQANLEIIRRLGEFRALELPVLVGPSRKGMIGKVLDLPVDDRLEGTAALTTLCIAAGASVLRVHDVAYMVRVARVTDALVGVCQQDQSL